MHDHAAHRRLELQKAAQRRVLECLQVIVHARFPGVMAAADALEEQLDLLVGDDVTDVLGVGEVAEGEPDHPVVGDRRSTAVAGIDRGIDLDPQPRGRQPVGDELDARDDAAGDRERGASGREAISEHRVLDLRQDARARQRRVAVEERLVIELQYRQIDARIHRHDAGRDLVAGLIPLDLDLARVGNDVSIGEDPFALDDHSRAECFHR